MNFMRTIKILLQASLAVFVTVVAVVKFSDATTIGTNVTTGGSLTVIGTTTIDSGVFYVDVTNDRVGISTSSPAQALDVYGNIAVSGTVDGYDISSYGTYFIDSAGTYGHVWMSDGSGRGVWTATSSLGLISGGSGTVNAGTSGQLPYYAGTGTSLSGTSSIYLSSAGYFGVSTTSPAYELTVSGDVMLTGSIYDNSYSAGNNGYVLQSSGSGIQWVATSTLGLGAGSGSGTVNTGAAGYFAYYSSASDSIYATSSIYVDSTGNIGIGTVTPDKKLQVAGESKLAGDVTLESGDVVDNSVSGLMDTTFNALKLIPLTATNTDTYTASANITEYATGTLFMVTFENSNTMGSYLDINGLGSKMLRSTADGWISTAARIRANSTHLLMYDPSLSGGSGAFVALTISQN